MACPSKLRAAATLLLALITVSGGALCETQALTISEVEYAPTTPYDGAAQVKVYITHNESSTPFVTGYYIILLNGTLPYGGWRVGQTALIWSGPPGLSVFNVSIPNPVYDKATPYESKVIFYIEARSLEGEVALSCREESRWDFTVTEDKESLTVTDPYPPIIANPTAEPDQATSTDKVMISLNATDGNTKDNIYSSDIEAVTIHYTVDGGRSWSESRAETLDGLTYIGEIPPKARGTEVTYYVEASDRAGNIAKASRQSYVVLPSVEELKIERDFSLSVGGLVAVCLASTVIIFRRRILEMRDKALTLALTLSVGLVGWGSWSLFNLGHRWPAVLLFLAAVEFWGIVDPRIRSILYNSILIPSLQLTRSVAEYLQKTFQENPPTVFVAAAYVVGFVGAVIVGGMYLTRLYSAALAYRMANIFATYVFFLLAAGVLGQLAWIIYGERRGKRVS